jgi:UDP-glucose 4-epimerase
MKTILVTGGAGFIGSHLCERLVADSKATSTETKIISLDNYFTGSRENHVEGVEYREGHTKDIEQLVPETPDIVYHLGEYSRVAKSIEEPDVVWDLNMDGTFAVLEFWRKKKCKLVYAGSSTKFTEARQDGVVGRDLSPYTWAKAVNSELVVNYSRWYDLTYVIVYFYNVYGPRERGGVDSYGTIIETFKQNYLKKEPHQIRAPGTQTRAFTHVADTVSGILLASEKGENDEYGICADDVYSLLELAEMYGGEIVMLPATKTTRSSEAMDTSKLTALGWKQEHTLKEYIESVKKEHT